jgi:hypothetical protein
MELVCGTTLVKASPEDLVQAYIWLSLVVAVAGDVIAVSRAPEQAYDHHKKKGGAQF